MIEKSINVNLDSALAQSGISVVFMLAQGRLSSHAEEVLSQNWLRVQTKFRAVHTLATVLNHPHLEAYRKLHSGLGISESNIVPSPESLIRKLFQTERLQSLGPIVDLYNSISLQHLVSIGAHDAEKLGGRVSLAMNNSEIRFRPLGQKKKLSLPANEYSYQTENNRAICRLECKQANETKLRPDTNSWFFILQGNQNIGPDILAEACESLTQLLKTHLEAHCFSTAMLHGSILSANLTLPGNR